jgi:uncharacterized GH25 family protein
MRRSFLAVSIAIPALLAIAGPLFAHGAWVVDEAGKLVVVYGHGDTSDAYDPAKIAEVGAVDAAGAPVAVEVIAEGERAALKPAAEPAAVFLTFDNGFWSQGPDGEWVNKPRSEVEGATQAGHYVKTSVALFEATAEPPALPAQKLQIVPAVNPVGLAPGSELKVRVLFEGAPLPGVSVMGDFSAEEPPLSAPTDAAGETVVTIANDGFNIVAVEHAVALENDPDADEVSYLATLSFEAAQ